MKEDFWTCPDSLGKSDGMRVVQEGFMDVSFTLISILHFWHSLYSWSHLLYSTWFHVYIPSIQFYCDCSITWCWGDTLWGLLTTWIIFCDLVYLWSQRSATVANLCDLLLSSQCVSQVREVCVHAVSKPKKVQRMWNPGSRTSLRAAGKVGYAVFSHGADTAYSWVSALDVSLSWTPLPWLWPGRKCLRKAP